MAKGSLGGQCTSLSNPTPDDAWTGSAKRNYLGTNTKATSRAAYVFDTIELDPKWLLNVGVRYDTFDTVANTNAAAGRTKIMTTASSSTGRPAWSGSRWTTAASTPPTPPRPHRPAAWSAKVPMATHCLPVPPPAT